MDSVLVADLAATCNALGYYDVINNKYLIDEFSLETVKDLIKHLRRDNEQFEIRRWLGQTNVLRTDLLPMLRDHGDNDSIFEVLLRLLVNLTNPILLMFHEEPPADKEAYKYYLEIISHSQCYKESFADQSIWAVINNRLIQLLNKENLERDEDTSLNIERVLILIRNVLNITDNDNTNNNNDSTVSVHDRVLRAINQSKISDSLLQIVSSNDEKIFYMHVLEIISLIYRGQCPTTLAKFQLIKSIDQQIQEDNDLLARFNKEQYLDNLRRNSLGGGRHSKFGGTIVLENIKGISDKNLIVHKSLTTLNDLNLDKEKKKIKVPKNRALIDDKQLIRESESDVCMFLKEFAIDFLNKSYNMLMFHVRGCFVRGRAQEHDESYYLWALRFFMEFNRCYQFQAKLVKETLSVQIYYFVQQEIERYFDILRMEKKKAMIWTKRLHLALQAYRELLASINMMDRDVEQSIRELGKSIKNEIFYTQEYRELILTLFLRSNEIRMSYNYFCDLMESQFVFLRMLEKYCKEEKTTIIVEKYKTVRTKKKKKQNNETVINSTTSSLQIQSDEHWNEISNVLEDILSNSNNIVEMIPFDAASDIPIDDQKEIALRRIQMNLQQKEFDIAISLLRSSREVWIDPEILGTNNSSAEEEFLLLKDIYFKQFKGDTLPTNVNTSTYDDLQKTNEELDEFSDGEAEDDEVNKCAVETVFNFEDFIKRFVNVKVVKICGLCLKEFERNSKMANFSLVKLMHRIAWDCRMPAMFFQASIFRSFQRLIPLKHYYPELYKFGMFIVKKFVEVANTNPKIFVELLFWKSSHEAYDVEEGYGSYKEKSSKRKSCWSEEQESELKVLCEEFCSKQLDEDMVDWIQRNLIDSNKTRRAILIQLKKMDLLGDYKRKSKHKSSKKATNSVVSDESDIDSNSECERENKDVNVSQISDSDEDIDWEKLRANRFNNKVNEIIENQNNITESDRTQQENVIKSTKKKRLKQKLTNIVSDNEAESKSNQVYNSALFDNDNNSMFFNDENVSFNNQSLSKKRKYLKINDSSNSDYEVNSEENQSKSFSGNVTVNNIEENDQLKNDSGDDKTIKRKHLRVIDSDSDEETIVNTSMKKAKRNIISDSD